MEHTLQSAVGFLYEGMSEHDESEVLKLIESNQLKIVVVTHKLALHYTFKGASFILDN